MLDYGSGEATCTRDQPGEFERNDLSEPQDVVEYWAVTWSKNNNSHQPSHEAGLGMDLSVEWYRDVLRAKLVSLRLPKRLLVDYKEKYDAEMIRIDALVEELNQRAKEKLLKSYSMLFDESTLRKLEQLSSSLRACAPGR